MSSHAIDHFTHRRYVEIALRGGVLPQKQSKAGRMMRQGLAIQTRQAKTEEQEERHTPGNATEGVGAP
ncbi:hypothetical protein [Burkholderia sp. Bp9031]|uniref:hypothetical protein n=1 Tax=Burkholderia sp. Bp9031 TaxID=2184566 RepID=UPI000F5E2043|nr:hypothetical protein [Burkholderia sp. Bp9031]